MNANYLRITKNIHERCIAHFLGNLRTILSKRLNIFYRVKNPTFVQNLADIFNFTKLVIILETARFRNQ